MSKYILFSDNESVVLLDICQWCIKNGLVRSDAVWILSRVLRQLAINQGAAIDESYRSVKGLTYQTNVMINFLRCRSQSIPKSFEVAYELYVDNKTAFFRRLRETLLMASIQIEESIFKYIIQKSPSSASDIYWSLQIVNEYALKNGMVSTSIYEELTPALVDLLKNRTDTDRAFRARNKKLLFHVKQGLSLLSEYAIQTTPKQESSTRVPAAQPVEKGEKAEEKPTIPHKNTDSTKPETIVSISLEELLSTCTILPTSFAYYGQKTDGIQSWNDLYVRLVRIIYREHQKKLCAASFYDHPQPGGICISNAAQISEMRNPKRIADNTFIETDFSDDAILMHIKTIMDICGIPLKRLQISGSRVDVPEANPESLTNPINEQAEEAIIKTYIDNCLTLLSESFPNGLKANSSIQQRRFRAAYQEKYGCELSDSVDLEKELKRFALYYSGKYYAVTAQMIELMRCMIEAIPEEHRHIIFYSMLYRINASQLSKCGVYSAEMLKAALPHALDGYFYENSYFSYRKHYDLSDEIVIAYTEDEVYLSLSELCERIPYAEPDQIRGICNRDPRLVYHSDAIYALESRIQIDSEDIKRTETYLTASIQKHGYAFITKLCIEYSILQNPDIPEHTLQVVMFQRYFQNKYSKNRKLISPLGVNISISDVLADYCTANSSLTLYELEEYEEELTGTVENKRALNTAVRVMVRTDKDSFVNTSEIQFDVEAVDSAIETYFDGTVISLASIKTFHAFPYTAGYVWNEYLLEGYLRHFSKEWAFLGSDTKDAVTGAVFRKETVFASYEDAMARAIVDAEIELTQEAVSDYLLKQKYRIRKGDMSGIISKAYQITIQKE